MPLTDREAVMGIPGTLDSIASLAQVVTLPVEH
jgi:hypothetical protein